MTSRNLEDQLHLLVVSDRSEGGAATAGRRLAAGFRRLGHRVTVVHAGVDVSSLTDGEVMTNVGRRTRLVEQQRRTPRLLDAMFTAAADGEIRRMLRRLEIDAVSIQNLHGARPGGWTSSLARVCADHAPTAWVLHDMWSFTGRCAYAGPCERFVDGCSAACPTPHEYPAMDPGRISAEWARRRRDVTHDQLHGIAPSRWMANEARRGAWPTDSVSVVPYGVPLELFTPGHCGTARRVLGLPEDTSLVLVAAHYLDDARKGMDLVPEVVRQLPRDVQIVAMGKGHLPETGRVVHHLGWVTDTDTKVAALQSVDVYLHPARADNLPLIVQEALACGTPVAAFNVGGLRDMVVPGQTGMLAEPDDVDGLATALGELIGQDLSSSCRDFAAATYDLRGAARRHLEILGGL